QDRPQQISGRPCDPPARSDSSGTATSRRVAGCTGNPGSPVQSATSSIRAGTTSRSPDPGRPAPGTAAHAPPPAATRARHRYARTPHARPAQPAGPGAEEQRLLHLLGPPLITTPRAAKRLANSYGLLSALHPIDLAASRDGDEPGWRAAMVLLATLVGYPEL